MTFEPTLPARTALTLALALLLWKRNPGQSVPHFALFESKVGADDRKEGVGQPYAGSHCTVRLGTEAIRNQRLAMKRL